MRPSRYATSAYRVVIVAVSANVTTVSDRQDNSANRIAPSQVTDNSPSGVPSAPPMGVPGSRNASGPATETMNSRGSVYQSASRLYGRPATPYTTSVAAYTPTRMASASVTVTVSTSAPTTANFVHGLTRCNGLSRC